MIAALIPGLIVNTAASAVAIGTIGLGLVTAQPVAAGCTFATNLALRRQLLFSPVKGP